MKITNAYASTAVKPSFQGRGLYSERDIEVNKQFIRQLKEIANDKAALKNIGDVFDKGYEYKIGGLFTNAGGGFCCDKESATNYAYTFSNEPGLNMTDYGVTISRHANNSDRSVAKNAVEQVEMDFSKDAIHRGYKFKITQPSENSSKTIYVNPRKKTSVLKNIDSSNPSELLNMKKILTEALADAEKHKSNVVPKKVFKQLKKGIKLIG